MHVFSNLGCAWKRVDVVVSFFAPLWPQEGKDKPDSTVKAQHYIHLVLVSGSCLDIEGRKSWPFALAFLAGSKEG